jgi:hypothetical protein
MLVTGVRCTKRLVRRPVCPELSFAGPKEFDREEGAAELTQLPALCRSLCWLPQRTRIDRFRIRPANCGTPTALHHIEPAGGPNYAVTRAQRPRCLMNFGMALPTKRFGFVTSYS